MTPYQEAVSLVDKFNEETSKEVYNLSYLCRDLAKDCAIIAVDLVIDAMGNVLNDEYGMKIQPIQHKHPTIGKK